MKPAMFSTLFNSLTCKAPVEWLEPPWPFAGMSAVARWVFGRGTRGLPVIERSEMTQNPWLRRGAAIFRVLAAG